MILSAFITKVRLPLQDASKNRWTDAEIEVYVNEGLKALCKEVLFNRITQTLSVVPETTAYTLTQKAIRFESIDTTQTYTITDNETITFTDPVTESVDVVYYGYTATVSLSTDDTLPIPDDLQEALKYFTLWKCYEKEDSTENFQKSAYFKGEYKDEIRNDLSRWHGLTDVTLAKQDYYE